MGANKLLENHMVIDEERHQADDQRQATQQQLERLRASEAVVTELAGAVDNAVTDLKEAGEEPKIIEAFVDYLDKLAAYYEAGAEVKEREIDFLTRNLGDDF